MIYSKIKYGISVYGLATTNYLNKIQVLQNQLLKVLLNRKYRYPTNRLHNEMGILKVKDIAEQEFCSFVHNYLSSNLPESFSGYFRPFSEVHSIDTRGTNKLQLPKPKKEIGKNTVKFKGSLIWNRQNDTQRNIKNPKIFRKSFKKNKLPYGST